MITFSEYDLQPVNEGLGWRADFGLDASILTVAGALGGMWICGAAIAWAKAQHDKALYRVFTVILAAALTVMAEQTGATGGPVLSEQILKIADFPMGFIQRRDAKIGAGFFDPAAQFPLARRLQGDFAAELPPAILPLVPIFVTDCPEGSTMAKLREATYADATAEIGGRSTLVSGASKNCKDLNREMGETVTNSRGSKSYFSLRLALGRESRRGVSNALAELGDGAAGEGLRVHSPWEVPVEDDIGLPEAGTLHGEVAEGFIKAFIAMPVFVLLPGGLWNLANYALGFMAARAVTGHAAFKLHQKELACVTKLNALDAQDANLEPLHAYETHYVKAGAVERPYLSAVKECVKSKRTTLWLERFGLGVVAGLMLVGMWVANR